MTTTNLIWTIVTGAAFVLLFATGGWLAVTGRGGNYSSAVITVHKLLSLLAAVATAVTIFRLASGK